MRVDRDPQAEPTDHSPPRLLGGRRGRSRGGRRAGRGVRRPRRSRGHVAGRRHRWRGRACCKGKPGHPDSEHDADRTTTRRAASAQPCRETLSAMSVIHTRLGFVRPRALSLRCGARDAGSSDRAGRGNDPMSAYVGSIGQEALPSLSIRSGKLKVCAQIHPGVALLLPVLPGANCPARILSRGSLDDAAQCLPGEPGLHGVSDAAPAADRRRSRRSADPGSLPAH